MPNIILLIVDTLRYDRLGASGYRPALTPNLDALVAGGVSCANHFANGCVTSFAFPSIFTSTLPLDHGGYDEGIRHRPVSFPEILQNHGYETFGIITGHPCSSHFGYDRGFDEFVDLIDLYQWFRSIYVASFKELLDLWQAGELPDRDLFAGLQEKYGRVLDDTARYIAALDGRGVVESGRRRGPLREAVRRERTLLDRDPELIARKILALGGDYQFALGEAELSQATKRRIARRNRRFARFNRRIHLLSQRRAFEAGVVNRQFEAYLRRGPRQPFFALLHFFDLHEAKLQISKLLAGPTPRRLSDAARAGIAIRRGRAAGQRGILYDMGLKLVDERVGELRRLLHRHGLDDDTVLVVTGDHGTEAGEPHRGLGSNLARLFYDEHLHVPLIVHGAGIEPLHIDGLASHLDLAPTIMEIAGLPVPPEFRGVPIWRRNHEPAEYVWSENAGLGRCRIADKTLHFGVRSRAHKSIIHADNFVAIEREFYDLASDPFERNNLSDSDGFGEVRTAHLNAVRARLDDLRDAREVA